MALLLSFGLFLTVYLGLVYLVFYLRVNSAIVAFVVAYPAFICFESLLLNVLSIFNAVNITSVIATHLLFCLGIVIHMSRHRRVAGNLWLCLLNRVRQLFRNASSPVILMLPLFFIIGLTAFLYVPNNYDSMTYHMARVAHWIQNESVDYYWTSNSRQNQMGPGAEYLILFFQIISGSDRLANVVQFFSYLLIPVSLYYLMRVIRIDRKTIPWIILICLTTPMAVLQASSTQNDLVDSLLTLVIILIGARLLVGNILRIQRNDIILAAICCSAGYLVKPISLIVVFPILLVGCLLQLKRVFSLLASRKGLSALLISLIVVTIICGPDIVRKITEGGFGRSEVYSLLSGWDATRFYNPVAVLAPNFPFPASFHEFIKNLGLPVSLFDRNVYHVHEDFIGNPVQLFLLIVPSLFAILFLPFGVIFGSKQRSTILLFALLPFLSWCSFAWIVKNQGWITRLQLPLFFLIPFSLAWLLPRWGHRDVFRLKYFVIVIITLFSYSYGIKIASLNPTRNLGLRFFWATGMPTPSENYYGNFDKNKEFSYFLNTAHEQNCYQSYLLVNGDYPEYPLTWMAMQSGIQIHHTPVEAVDDWACMVFADTVNPSQIPGRDKRWVDAGDAHTFIRNVKYEFERSSKVVAKLDQWDETLNLKKSPDLAELDYQGKELVINAENTDPYIYLPSWNGNTSEWCIIRIVMDSTVQTMFKLYYQTKTNEYYSENNVFRKQIAVGNNTIYFLLPKNINLNSLRIDPGELSATYAIQSVEIRRMVTQ